MLRGGMGLMLRGLSEVARALRGACLRLSSVSAAVVVAAGRGDARRCSTEELERRSPVSQQGGDGLRLEPEVCRMTLKLVVLRAAVGAGTEEPLLGLCCSLLR